MCIKKKNKIADLVNKNFNCLNSNLIIKGAILLLFITLLIIT